MMAHGVGAADWGEDGVNPVTWAKLRRILGYTRPYRALIALTFVLVLVSVGLTVIPVLLIVPAIFDDAIANGDRSQLVFLGAAFIVTRVLAGLVQVAQNWGNVAIGQRMMFDIRSQLYGHMLRMPLSFFTRTRSGEITTRLTNDINGIQQVVTTSFTNVMMNAVSVVITAVALMILDWRLTLVTAVALPAFIFPTNRVGRVRFAVARRAQMALGEMTALVNEKLNVSGIVLVKSFGRERDEHQRFDEVSSDVQRHQTNQAMVGRWFFMFTSLYGTVAPAAIYVIGGWFVISGEMRIGEIVAFSVLATSLYMPVSMLLQVHVDVAGSFALFDRLFDYMDRPVEIDEKPDAMDIERGERTMAFDGVEFAYEPGNPVLKDVSFEAKPGQLVALVGPSGAGKTTVTYLLGRLYDPTGGAVTLDGHDLRDLSFATLSRHIGMVTQETHLFHASVRDNLLYARPDATEDEIEAAARAAHIHDVIAAMPNGYDTLVGERGYRLSGGEQQRLAIARIILKDPHILLLDEATSSLDSHSERLIKEALEPVLRSRTSVVIAHRLSTIMGADQILVMDGGRIVERGTHRELLEAGGVYARLYHEQFKDGAVEVDTPLADEASDGAAAEPAAAAHPHAMPAAMGTHGAGSPAGPPPH